MEKEFEKATAEVANDASTALLEDTQPTPKLLGLAGTQEAIDLAGARLQSRYEQSQRSLSELGITLTPEQQAHAQKHLQQLKDLQAPLLSGDVNRLHQFVKDLKEPLPKIAEAVQNNLRYLGALDLTLDVDDQRQLIIFVKGQSEAMLFSKQKVDVIGFNSDGSFNYGARFPGENNEASMERLSGRLLHDVTPRRDFPPPGPGKPKLPLSLREQSLDGKIFSLFDGAKSGLYVDSKADLSHGTKRP